MLFAHSADHAMGYCVGQERYKKQLRISGKPMIFRYRIIPPVLVKTRVG